MRERRLSWLVGGIGLVACGVVGVVRGSVLAVSGANTVLAFLADALWAGAILVLAFGLSREGSAVARKPLGLTSSALVALWPLTDTVVTLIAAPVNLEQARAWEFWAYVSMVVPVMVGLIAAVQVARAGTVPAPWNWAPLWILAAQTAIRILPLLVGAASPAALIETAGLMSALGTLGFLTTTLGLGFIAILLADRTRARTVTVFPSSAPD